MYDFIFMSGSRCLTFTLADFMTQGAFQTLRNFALTQ